ncbi:MAG: hypothetical protein WC516_09985 [Patescibacteria group bacterium]|jgi:hypothetical protein|nr:hypothetical protein [Sideroxydans sp.]
MTKNELYKKAMMEEVHKPERWIEHPENHFRFVGKYQDIYKGRDSHNGWYMDPFYNDVSYGIVYQLTGRKGQTRYVAGCSDGYDNDAYSKINVKDIFDEKEDAAREGNEMARIYAEHNFESFIKQNAEEEIDLNKQSISDIRKVIKEICLELRNEKSRMSQIIYHAVVDDIRNKVKEIQSLRKEIRKYEDDPSWCWN